MVITKNYNRYKSSLLAEKNNNQNYKIKTMAITRCELFVVVD